MKKLSQSTCLRYITNVILPCVELREIAVIITFIFLIFVIMLLDKAFIDFLSRNVFVLFSLVEHTAESVCVLTLHVLDIRFAYSVKEQRFAHGSTATQLECLPARRVKFTKRTALEFLS